MHTFIYVDERVYTYKTRQLLTGAASGVGDAARGLFRIQHPGFLVLIDSGSGRGTARAEDAQGAPTQSHISPSILVYEY